MACTQHTFASRSSGGQASTPRPPPAQAVVSSRAGRSAGALWGPCAKGGPPVMRAASSRKALPPETTALGIRFPYADSAGGTISPQQTPYLVIGLPWPQPEMRSISQVNGREGPWEALTELGALSLGIGHVTIRWSVVATGSVSLGRREHSAHRSVRLKLFDYLAQAQRRRRKVWTGPGKGPRCRAPESPGKGSEALLPERPVCGLILIMTLSGQKAYSSVPPDWEKREVGCMLEISISSR